MDILVLCQVILLMLILLVPLILFAGRDKNFDGIINIYHNDPTKDLLGMELFRDLDEIEEKEYLTFKVLVHDKAIQVELDDNNVSEQESSHVVWHALV